MEEKKEVFKFAARCRDQDRQYEINNNAELDNGVYHKFVYSTKDSKADEKEKKKQGRENDENALLSRNSSRHQLNPSAENSEDLTKARDRQAVNKKDIKAEREALKADIMRLKTGKNTGAHQSPAESEDELANTNASHFSVALGESPLHSLTINLVADEDRVATLGNFGYPGDYVRYTISENEANYCVTGYYLLGLDQNY